MALSFTEGSIGGDIERVSLAELEAFYGSDAGAALAPCEPAELAASRPARTASRSRPADTSDGHALLLINPHTSFFFRSELQMTSDEGLNAYGAVDLGPVLRLPGLQRPRRLDAHLDAASTSSTSSPRPSCATDGRLVLPLRHASCGR